MTRPQVLSDYPQDSLDFDEDFIKIDAAVCEYDSVGFAPQRKGESAFQWSSVETACVALLGRAKDVRVAIWYLRACIARRGLAGVADGLGRLADLMRAVDELHPRALPGESQGDVLVIHLGWLAGPQFLHQLGSARFVDREETLNDFVSGQAASIAADPDYVATALALVEDIQHALSGISDAVAAIGHQLDVAAALDLLGAAVAGLSRARPADANAVCDARPAVEMPRLEVAFSGAALRTRQEVGVALERIVDYFRTHEPSHPAPIFLSRIQRMLGSGFEEVMAELYPEAASLVAQLGRPQSAIK